MNTNDISTVIKLTEDIGSMVLDLKPYSFTILICICIGIGLKFLLRCIPWISNNWIPVILIFIVGPLLYFKLSNPDWDSAITMHIPVLKQLAMGLLCGLAAWFIHNKFIKGGKIEKWLFGEDDSKPLPENSHI